MDLSRRDYLIASGGGIMALFAGCAEFREPSEDQLTATLIDEEGEIGQSPLFLASYVGGVGPIRDVENGYRLFIWMNQSGMERIPVALTDTGAISNNGRFKIEFYLIYSEIFNNEQDRITIDLKQEFIDQVTGDGWNGRASFVFNNKKQAKRIRSILIENLHISYNYTFAET